MKALKKRAKNYGLWVSVFALAYMILTDFGVIVDAGHWQNYVDLLMGILIMAGVVSDPKAGKWFSDADKDMEKEE